MHRFVGEMYRWAQRGSATDFKTLALRQACALTGLHSAMWARGAMQDGQLVLLEWHAEGVSLESWALMQFLSAVAPLISKALASPGKAFVIGGGDAAAHPLGPGLKALGIQRMLSGTLCAQASGTFSIACWYRDAARPDFSAKHQQLLEQWLPFFVDCINLCRVSEALRDLDAVARRGYFAALSDERGELLYQQHGFDDALRREYPRWSGSDLPLPLLKCLGNGNDMLMGVSVVTVWRQTANALWLLHVRKREPLDSLTAREREVVHWLALGESVKEVSKLLGISPSTVDNLRTGAYSKLKVRNRAQLTSELNRSSFGDEWNVHPSATDRTG